MEISSQLIQRFFENKCDPEEFEAVLKHLELHPEQAAPWLDRGEWDAAGEPGDGLPAPDHDHAVVLDELRRRLFGGSRTSAEAGQARETEARLRSGERVRREIRSVSLVSRFSWTAVAASVLLAAGGWVWLAKRKDRPGMAKMSAAPQERSLAAGGGKARDILRANTTGNPQNILLPDGTKVKLYGHSAIRYTDSFGVVRRDVRLEGRADLAVSKDLAHPFCVLTDRLSTTVLGTSFEVKAPGGGGNIEVRLYTGKVVVKSIGSLPGWKDILLSPGQEMVYDRGRMLATVKPFAGLKGGADGDGMANEAGDLVFSNSPLKKVFHSLSLQYHKKFIYRAGDLHGLNFTGMVMRTDSLDTFLHLLGTMNHLEIQEQPAGITVTRRGNSP